MEQQKEQEDRAIRVLETVSHVEDLEKRKRMEKSLMQFLYDLSRVEKMLKLEDPDNS